MPIGIQKCFQYIVQPSVKQKEMLFVVKNYGRSGVVSHKMHVFQKAKESVCNLCVPIKMDNLPMEN